MLNDSYGISFFSFYFKTGHSSSLVQTFSVMGNEELRDESNGFFSGLFSALIWFRSFWNYYYFYLLSPLPLFLSWNAVRLSLWVRGYLLWIRFLGCFWDWLSLLSLQDCLQLTQDYPACSQRWRDALHWVTEPCMCLPVWCKKFLLTQEQGIFVVFLWGVCSL